MPQTLKDSEIRYRRLFEAAQDGILILNAETGEIDDANPYLTKMLGFSRDELIQKKLWQVGAFTDVAASQDAFATLQANEYIRYEDLPLKTKDGRLIQVEFVSNVYLVGTEKVIQCNIRDITRRKQAERNALESHERYRNTLNYMMEGCQIIDYDWRYIYINDAAAKHGQKEPVELLMHTMMDVYPGIENTDLFHKLQISMNDRVRQRIENQFLFTDGSYGWFELSIQPVPEGIFILSIDITGRKQAEEMQAKLAIIVEASDDAIFGTWDGVITSWNLGAEHLYGYSTEEAVGLSVFSLTPPDLVDESAEIIQQIIQGKSVKNFETVRLRKDGTRVHVSLTISPIKDDSGKIYAASTIAHDITQRKQAERELAEAHTFLGNILNYSPVGILTYKFTGECLAANEYAAQTVGATVAQLLSQNFHELDSWKQSGLHELAEKTIATHQQQSADIYIQTTFGKGIWLRAQFVVFQSRQENCLLLTIVNITERKQAEEALRESERQYRQIIETTQEGVWAIDAHNQTTLANQRLADMFGYTIEEMTGKPIDVFLDEEGKAIAPFIIENLRQGINKQLDFKFKHKNGSAVWTLVETNTLQDAQGNYIGALAMLTDITSRRQMEDALRTNEERLKLALAATRTGVWEWNAQTNQVFWSPECYEIVGLDRSTETTLQAFLGLVHPDDLERVNTTIQQSLTKKEQFAIDFRIINPHNELLWVQDIGKAEYDANDLPTRMVGTVSDITARKKSEELLRESDSRFRALIENSTDAITLLDGKGIAIYDSPAAPGMLGYTSEDWIGQDVFKLLHPDDLHEIQTLFESLLQRAGTRLNSTFRVRHKNGYSVWLEMVATNLLTQPGVNAIVLNYRDVTNRKQADERLRSAREFLQSVQDALSAHIAILDHEGKIVQVNAAWRDFGAQNGLTHPNFCIGENYLDVCDKASGDFAEEAKAVANAIRDVLSDGQSETWVEYPCHSPHEKRWFIARITSFENNGQKWIVVSHANITERRQAEEKIKRQLEHLTALSTIDRAIASNFDLKLNLAEILTHVTKELGVAAADIFILNAYSLEFGAESGFRSKAIRKAQIHLTDPYTGRVVMERRLIQIPNLQNQAAPTPIEPRWIGEDFTGYYAVPLIVKGQVKGVLEVFPRHPLEPDREWFDLLNTLAGQTAIAIENASLFSSLQRSNSELVMAYDATIEGWSRALDLRDKETEGHSLRVTQMTLKLARSLGLTDEELMHIRWGSLLHDIGKMGIPDSILLKPGKLTDEEWVIMKKHPTFAYQMLSPIHYLRQALDIPYCHHEKWDGSGYPRGLKGTQIPLAARIFAVVDVWDALKSDRPYRAGWADEKIREHIQFSSKSHFDPEIVDAFLKVF